MIHETFRYFEVASTRGLAETSEVRLSAAPRARFADTELESPARLGPGFVSGDGWFLTKDRRSLIARREGVLRVSTSANIDRHILTFLDWLLSEETNCLVHAASVATDGRATLLSGWGGVGKTATLARLCREKGVDFVADDMVFLGDDGTVRSFPKPMYVYPYHRPLFPHLFEADHKPLVPPVLTNATESLRRMVRPVVASSPKLENWARRHTPEHMKVDPGRALPETSISDTNQLGLVVRLARTEAESPIIRELDGEVALDGLVHEEFRELIDVTGIDAVIAASSAGVSPLERWLGNRRRILAGALRDATVVSVDLPRQMSAKETARTVARLLD